MYRYLFISCLYVLMAGTLRAQAFHNPSFEGPIQLHFPPPDWYACHPNSTPDTGPGSWGQALSPSDGQSFVVLVIRDYTTPEQNVEEISQFIDPPLQAGQSYYFSVDLGYLPDLAHLPGQTSLAAPCRLQVWGAPDLCQPGKLLWESPVINHASWRPYNVSFTADSSISVLRFASAHAVATAPTRGNVCLDRLSPILPGPPPQPDLGRDTTLCEGDSLWVSLPEGGVRWQDGDTARARWLSEAGTYWVDVLYPVRYARPGGTGGGWIWADTLLAATDTLVLTTRPRPNLRLGPDTLLCLGESLWLGPESPAPDATYLWADGYSGPQRQVDEPGTFVLTVSEQGCTATDRRTVAYRDCRAWLTFPNVFSPNGDGINDAFIPTFDHGVSSLTLYIYDRWGREVYASQRLRPGWDGTWRGRMVDAGLYIWAARWVDPQGTIHQDRGSLTLLR